MIGANNCGTRPHSQPLGGELAPATVLSAYNDEGGWWTATPSYVTYTPSFPTNVSLWEPVAGDLGNFAASANQPDYVPNDSRITFDGTEWLTTSVAPSVWKPCHEVALSIMAVVRFTQTTGSSTIIDNGGQIPNVFTGFSLYRLNFLDLVALEISGSSTPTVCSTTRPLTTNTLGLIEATWSASAGAAMRVNGGTASSATNGNTPSSADPSGDARVGNRWTGVSNPHEGDVRELLILRGHVWSSSEATTLREFFAARHNITLP